MTSYSSSSSSSYSLLLLLILLIFVLGPLACNKRLVFEMMCRTYNSWYRYTIFYYQTCFMGIQTRFDIECPEIGKC